MHDYMFVRAWEQRLKTAQTWVRQVRHSRAKIFQWIHVELIKSFQKSIGSMGPRRGPAKKQKVEDVRYERQLLIENSFIRLNQSFIISRSSRGLKVRAWVT